jgi:hypothetical protein
VYDMTQVLFDKLDERGLLDNSLIILQGDHGPRIGIDGEIDNGSTDLSLPVPFLLHTGTTRRQTHSQITNASWNSLDVVPTILDSLDIHPSITAAWEGHSMIRPPPAERRTFHLCDPGGKGPQLREGDWKVEQKTDGDLCGWDNRRDGRERHGWCVNAGWMEGYDPDQQKWRTGEEDWSNKDELAEFQRWVREAGAELVGRLQKNFESWGWNRTEHQAEREAFMTMIDERKVNGTLYRPPLPPPPPPPHDHFDPFHPPPRGPPPPPPPPPFVKRSEHCNRRRRWWSRS